MILKNVKYLFIFIIQKLQTFVRIDTHTSICPKIRIAALYYIDKCHQQLTISQLIFALSTLPLIGIRLMLTPPNWWSSIHLSTFELVMMFKLRSTRMHIMSGQICIYQGLEDQNVAVPNMAIGNSQGFLPQISARTKISIHILFTDWIKSTASIGLCLGAELVMARSTWIETKRICNEVSEFWHCECDSVRKW